MELTQRLECTQELYTNNSKKTHPEQIGFLGICGKKYPLKKGPNKIGRDPATCNIILNFNSISRLHAVINILNSQEFMLMDLDSTNKTKLRDKTLDAYIPHPLKNGDIVQFGQIFGVFRLLEEDNDLPMTRALDIPETPVQKKHVSKLNNVHDTTIPKSPDVSDSVKKPSPFKQKEKINPELKIVNQISDVKKPNDLCSQGEFSQEIAKIPKISKDGDNIKVSVTEKIASHYFVSRDKSDDIGIEDEIDNYVNSLPYSQILDIIGGNKSPRKSSEPKASIKNVNPDTFSKLQNYNETKKSSPSSKDGDSSSREDNDAEKKSHRSRNKSTEKRESNEKIVRRSKRQVTQKLDENLRNYKISKASTSKGHHEQSAIYNLSSKSPDRPADSPHTLRRSATENFDVPSTKKRKIDSNSKNLSVRSISPRKVETHYVLFTAFSCEEVKMKLEKLGAIIVTDVLECTVVHTIKIKRTFKLLCAVGLGKAIVGPSWVQACVDANIIVDPWQYLIRDEETERRFQFNLERSLAGRRNFLKGYNVSSTPSVIPNAQDMKLIVECSGGTWKDGGPNWICISSLADETFWPALKKKGAEIVSVEFILAGVLRQRVEIDKNKLY